MAEGTGFKERGPQPLREGSELAGLQLRRLIAQDGFCSLWVTEALEEGFPETCIRAIPAANLKCANAQERFCSELAFWQNFPGSGAVDLYDCGLSAGYYFMVMRYIADGSAEDLARGDEWLRARLANFALDFAAALRDLHGSSGAHGNIKPTNVFPLRDGRVLLSDFAVPLWLDELEGGCKVLAPHVLHPYRAPEQRDNPRDFDTRSDVYSFGLVLVRCLTGAAPTADGRPAEVPTAEWPARLAATAQRCLERDRKRRPADGFELFEMLGAVGESAPRGPAEAGAGRPEREETTAVADELGEQEVARRLEKARALVDEGALDEAVEALESLPAGDGGVAELLDEIEERHRASEELTEEAVRLAGIGKVEAALETIEKAEQLHAKSQTVMAVKDEVAAAADRDAALLSGRFPEQLREALDAGKYAAARSLLEKTIRRGQFTDEIRRAIGEFKKGRVRKAFLDNIHTAKRLYVLGHRQEAGEHWLEAARWLPSGPQRERLRRIAGHAVRGRLRVDMEQADSPVAGLARQVRGGPLVDAELQRRLSEIARKPRRLKRKVLLVLLAVVGLLVGGGAALLWALLSD